MVGIALYSTAKACSWGVVLGAGYWLVLVCWQVLAGYWRGTREVLG